MELCLAPRNDGKPCGRDALQSEGEFCIFHDPGPKDPNFVRVEFEQLVARTKAGAVDATGFVFPDLALHKVEFPRHVLFHRARFTARALFMECTFHEGADFLDAHFEGPASFHKSILRGGGFQRATFAEDADFGGCQFEGACDFGRARFLGHASFASARFVQRLEDGQRSGYFVFMGTQFLGATDFSLAKFERSTTFQGARFGDVAEFAHVDLQPVAPRTNLVGMPVGLEPSLDFSRVRVERVDGVRFLGPAFPFSEDRRQALDLGGVRLHGSDVARMQFADVRWGPHDGADKGLVFDEADRPLFTGSFDWAGNRAEGERLALLYKGLRESYERHLLYAEAGRFHVREMECRRRTHGLAFDAKASKAQSPWKRKAWSSLARLRRRANLLNAYRLASNYGESYAKAFWSALGWFLVMAAFKRWIRPRLSPAPLGEAHALVNEAIALMPAQVAGDSLTDFVTRLVGAFLIAGFVIALRRHFRR